MSSAILRELKNMGQTETSKAVGVKNARKGKKSTNPMYREIESERRHINFMRIIPASLTLLIIEICGMLWAVWAKIKFDYGTGFLISSCIFVVVSSLFIVVIERGLRKPYISDQYKRKIYIAYWACYTIEALSFAIMELLDRGTFNNYSLFLVMFTLIPVLEPITKGPIYIFACFTEIYFMLSLQRPFNDITACLGLTIGAALFSNIRYYFYISDTLAKKLYQYSANGDQLTEFMNRRGFVQQIPSLRGFCQSNDYKLCTMMFDIDDFKKFNDTHGHLKGDMCLKAVADCVRADFSRPTDICVRYGGEEFLVVTAQRDIDRLVEHLSGTLEAVNKIKIEGVHETISVSVGLFAVEDDEKRPIEYFIENADKQLYNSKKHGKNCISYNDEIYK